MLIAIKVNWSLRGSRKWPFVLLVALSSQTSVKAMQLRMICDLPTAVDDSFRISEANALSADGKTVVGTLRSGTFRGAFRWTSDEGFVDVGDLRVNSILGYNYSQLHGVSDDGRIVVGSSSIDALRYNEAIKWTEGQGLVGLGDLPGGIHSSFAMAVSGNGHTIVGSAADENSDVAVRWTESGGLERLPGGELHVAIGVSADGTVVIGSSFANPLFIVRRRTPGSTPIGDLPGGEVSNYPLDISADGTTVVGYSGSDIGGEAYRWTRETGIVGLGLLPGGISGSRATGVNADGSVIVGTAGSGDSHEEGYIWNERDGMISIRRLLIDHNVDVAGWILSRPVGISDDGLVILGNGYFEGRSIAWLIDLSEVPEPRSDLMIVAGMLILPAALQRRKKETRSPGPL